MSNMKKHIPYYQIAPLIEQGTLLSFPLIPLLLANKGIRETGKRATLLLRELVKNKGFDRHMNPGIFESLNFGIFES